MEDGIFWFWNPESILAHPEEMINRTEAALEENTCTQENLFTIHSLQQISCIVCTKAFCKTKLHSRENMQVIHVYLRLQNGVNTLLNFPMYYLYPHTYGHYCINLIIQGYLRWVLK